jgi:hypothetical protein
MSRRARAGVAALASLGAVTVPGFASAHALGGATYTLPLPLWLYLAGAAVAVAASFVVTTRVARDAGPPSYRMREIGERTSNVSRVVLRNLGIAWWYGAIGVGLVVGDISPLPAVLLWIGIWVGLPITSVVLGNPWPSLSPFRTTFAGLEWLARRMGLARLDVGLTYPAWLGRWPAVVLLAGGFWAELILPGSASAATVALLMTAYLVLTLAGMILFGQVAWLRHAELFEVELGWLGHIGAIGRRSVSAELCEGCGEACRVERCIDCPECAVAAEDPDRRAGRRDPIRGLTDVVRGNASDAAFIVLLLGGVTFDGLRETAFGASILERLLPPLTDAFGVTLFAFLLADTVAFALVVGAFGLAFAVVLALIRRIGRVERMRAGVYASTLLPIAAGYLIAHYLTLVIQGLIWLPALIVDPLMSLAPDLSFLPVSAIWYLSVIAIVGGHIAAVVLAHRVALRDSPGRATVAGLPLVVLMVGYTILSLWIIAQPIVVDPGAAPSALR